MNSQKITVNNQAAVRTPDGAVLVKGKFYNELREDVLVNETAIAANGAAIGTLNPTQYSGALTDGAPTDAELDAAIGSTPAAVGAGWRTTVIDTDGTALVYDVVSDGTNWWYTAMTKAV